MGEQQKSAAIMTELVEETIEMMKSYYEKKLSMLESDHRKMEENHKNTIQALKLMLRDMEENDEKTIKDLKLTKQEMDKNYEKTIKDLKLTIEQKFSVRLQNQSAFEKNKEQKSSATKKNEFATELATLKSIPEKIYGKTNKEQLKFFDVPETSYVGLEKLNKSEILGTNNTKLVTPTQSIQAKGTLNTNSLEESPKTCKLSSRVKYNVNKTSEQTVNSPIRTLLSLRLRKRKYNENVEQDYDKTKKIKSNMFFSDNSKGLPRIKEVKEPEKVTGKENIPPVTGIQICPSKSEMRPRRKLFTPRAEPIEDTQCEDSDSDERVYFLRPAYHKRGPRRKL